MINDGVPQQTKEWFLDQSIDACLQCLDFMDMFEIAFVLKQIRANRPKIYVVQDWPDSVMIPSEENGQVDIMIFVNGLIANLGCELVIEGVSE